MILIFRPSTFVSCLELTIILCPTILSATDMVAISSTCFVFACSSSFGFAYLTIVIDFVDELQSGAKFDDNHFLAVDVHFLVRVDDYTLGQQL